MTNQQASNANMVVNSGTSTGGFFITNTATTQNMFISQNGNWVNYNHGYANPSYVKMLEDGDPLVKITTEDNLFCVSFCYSDEESCQEIPEDFDIDFGDLLTLAITQLTSNFKSLLSCAQTDDKLIQMVYTIDGREYTISIQDIEKLVNALP